MRPDFQLIGMGFKSSKRAGATMIWYLYTHPSTSPGTLFSVNAAWEYVKTLEFRDWAAANRVAIRKRRGTGHD